MNEETYIYNGLLELRTRSVTTAILYIKPSWATREIQGDTDLILVGSSKESSHVVNTKRMLAEVGDNRTE